MISPSPSCRAGVPPVPRTFQDLYTSLNQYLTAFNATLDTGKGAGHAGLLAGTLKTADANTGPVLVNPGYNTGVQAELQALKAMGVQAVDVEVGFPMLYRPFFSSQSEYQQYVNFYAGVAASIRALSLKLIVENNCLLSNDINDGWNTAPFYSTLNWTQYQKARAQTAQVVLQTMQPDFLVVVEEPDTEATMSGQSEANTISGSTGMLNQILTGIQQVGAGGTKIGASVGTWTDGQVGPLGFIESFVATAVDFIDMHVFPVNRDYLPNALSIASIAAAAGKPVSSSQSWLKKVRDSELGTFNTDSIRARDPFSFWAPLDAYFLQTMVKLATYTHMIFLAPSESEYFATYLPYYGTSTLTPAEIVSQEYQQAAQSILEAHFTSTGISYYNAIVQPADAIPPFTPNGPAGTSGNPTTAYLTWDPTADNVGTAGYYVQRDGRRVTTTSQTSYQDTGLSEGTTYSYAIEAFDLAGNISPPSLTVHVTTRDVTPPSTPENVVATAVSKNEITLTWSASTDNESVSSYRVFRGTTGGVLSKILTLFASSTSVNNYSLKPGTTYYYAVEAADGSGNVSPMSAVVSATTPSGN